MVEARKAAKKSVAKGSGTFTAEEKAAMREYAREKKAQQAGVDGETEVLAKIAEMGQPDRGMAERIHRIIKEAAPELSAKTWYGMPAYANKEGRTICFFQPAEKFKARYSTLGFNDGAKLDDGSMWASAFAITKLTDADEKKIAALVKKAVS